MRIPIKKIISEKILGLVWVIQGLRWKVIKKSEKNSTFYVSMFRARQKLSTKKSIWPTGEFKTKDLWSCSFSEVVYVKFRASEIRSTWYPRNGLLLKIRVSKI